MECFEAVEEAKREETRGRRIERAAELLPQASSFAPPPAAQTAIHA